MSVPVFAQGQDAAPSGIAGPPVETAFAMPRSAAPDDAARWRDGMVAMPQPLSTANASRIRTIFALQAAGRFDEAARATRSVQDRILLPDILADRRERTSPSPPPAPDSAAASALPAESPAATPPEEIDPAEHAFGRNPMLDRTVQARLAQGPAGARRALRLVAATRFPVPLYAATLRAEIARAAFTSGDDTLALHTAQASLRQSGGRIGAAGLVAGLAAWRQNRISLAQSFFEQATHADLTDASTRAGAAFWAARAHRRLGDEAGQRAWLRRAAAFSHTFYGILAGRMLKRAASPVVAVADSAVIHLAPETLAEIDVEAVAAKPDGRHAFALLQVDQPRRAEMALRQLWMQSQADPALCRSIALVAQAAGLTDLSEQLATILQDRDGRPRDAARFPLPPLRPRHGFIVNPALVYALARVESNFNSKAVSGAGAHGLMQIMPVTARFVLGPDHHFRNEVRALQDPAINLQVGQYYLAYLADQDRIGGDLIRLLASYNAGPTAVAHWCDGTAAAGDPLQFIEALPARETRDFVHRTLTYLWIYSARLNRPAPSLDRLAAGGWPRFAEERLAPVARTERISAWH